MKPSKKGSGNGDLSERTSRGQQELSPGELSPGEQSLGELAPGEQSPGTPSTGAHENGCPSTLLRFLSRDLDVQTRVVINEGDLFLQLIKEGELVGSRRLGKKTCCRSQSPCIGPIPVSEKHQAQYGLPAFIHTSLCHDEITSFLQHPAQTNPSTL